MNEGIEGQKDDDLQIVTFRVGEEDFSVSILKVQEIIRMSEITKVPRSPEFVEGVINLRGKVIPVIDLSKRFGLIAAERDNDTRTIVVDCGGKVVGLIVDSVTEVLRLSKATVEPPPDIVGGVDSDYISGVGKLDDRLVILLDIDKVLNFSEQALLGTIEAPPAEAQA
jgi:purine-binding chemotaxis protein CheW